MPNKVLSTRRMVINETQVISTPVIWDIKLQNSVSPNYDNFYDHGEHSDEVTTTVMGTAAERGDT